MKYKNVIIIGTGKIACQCIEIVFSFTDKIECIEHDKFPLSAVKMICQKNNIYYRLIDSKEELKRYFLEITERTLIISANNNYIFPKDVLSNDKLKIINFHSALLPYHRGRNAITWSIFEMNKCACITWHEVNDGIDTGRIIAQRMIPLDSRITALELTKKAMDLSAETFTEIIEYILNDNYKAEPQHDNTQGSFHYSMDVPNNGILDLSWSIDKISAFLRSLDYGKVPIFPKPKLIFLGEKYSINKYRIENSDEKNDNRLIIRKDYGIFNDQGILITIQLE